MVYSILEHAALDGDVLEQVAGECPAAAVPCAEHRPALRAHHGAVAHGDVPCGEHRVPGHHKGEAVAVLPDEVALLRREIQGGSRTLMIKIQIMASVKTYPHTILSTPATSGYYISYKWVLRAAPHKPLRSGIF